jgi:HD-GYP domain-containing protein (c-di-GMP phosphodiesterase class II)/DNA-binding CsgD family transcriptional regulator
VDEGTGRAVGRSPAETAGLWRRDAAGAGQVTGARALSSGSVIRLASGRVSLATVERLRLAELIAALSVAIDLGMSNPSEAGLRSCVLAVELASALGVDEPTLVETYYLALLRLVGCTSEAHTEVEVFGDELGRESWIRTVETRPGPMLGAIVTQLGAEDPPLRRIARVATALAGLPRIAQVPRAHCEVASRLSDRLGFGAGMHAALTQAFERWDGGGPYGVRGDAVALSSRLVAFAQDVVAFHVVGGLEAAVAMAAERGGRKHDPAVAGLFRADPTRFTVCLEEHDAWERVLAAEPGARPWLSEAELDRAARAMADFADLKAPSMSGHSSGVADLAVAAAERCGIGEREIPTLRRAALLHDLGRAGVSAAIWNKPGPLSVAEWERVRLHPYYTERVLSRAPALAGVAALAGLHHERLDGSGYHRGLPAQLQAPAARLIAAADAYHAMGEPRPYRDALPPDRAADELKREARAGRLCADAVAAVLAAAGHRVKPARREWPGGLSEREVEVLRLLARGLSNKQIAERLVVSRRTVDHHVEHIYDKVDVSTRAAATLFAMQHDLLEQ